MKSFLTFRITKFSLFTLLLCPGFKAEARQENLREQRTILLLPAAPPFQRYYAQRLAHLVGAESAQVASLDEEFLALTAQNLRELAAIANPAALELNLIVVPNAPSTFRQVLSLLELEIASLPELRGRLLLNLVVTDCDTAHCILEFDRHALAHGPQPLTLLALPRENSLAAASEMLDTLSVAARIAHSFEKRGIAPWSQRTSAVAQWSRILSNLPTPHNRAQASGPLALGGYTTFVEFLEALEALPLAPQGHLGFIELAKAITPLGGLAAFNTHAPRDNFGALYLRSILEDDLGARFLALEKLISSPDLALLASREFLVQALSHLENETIPNETPNRNLRLQIQAMRSLQQLDRTSLDSEHWQRLASARQEFSLPILRAILAGTGPVDFARLTRQLDGLGQRRELFRAAILEIHQEREAISQGLAPRRGWLRGVLTRLILSQEPDLVALGRYMTLDLLASPPSPTWQESFVQEIHAELSRRDIAPEARLVLARMGEAFGLLSPEALRAEIARVRNDWFRRQRNRRLSPLLAQYLYNPLAAWKHADQLHICQEKLL